MSDTEVKKTPAKGITANDDSSKVKLLVTCIKHANNGTINWQAVAEECDIQGTDGNPSKGAASKRYDRILKSYNCDKPTASKSNATTGEDGAPTPKKKPTPRKKAVKEETGDGEGAETPTKKRKKSSVKKADSPIKEDSPVADAETALAVLEEQA